MSDTPLQMPAASLAAVIASYGIPLRSFMIALVIARSLTLINQQDAVLGDRPLNLIQLALSFATPFAVIALSQALAIRRVFPNSFRAG